MRRFNALLWILLATLAIVFAVQLPSLHAGIVIDGDIDPADVGDWSSTRDTFVGKDGYGTVDVNDDSDLFSNECNIGYNPDATGVVTVDGAGSTWTNSGSLYVARYGIGTLQVTHGGAVSNTFGNIGMNSGSTGVATVDGEGSTWTNSLLHVGNQGSATLDITGGGCVSSSTGYVTYMTDSPCSVTVDGDGSRWTNSSNLYIGSSGDATLDVTGGGSVSDSLGIIGNDSTSTGRVTVDGGNSRWTNDSGLFVGYSGNAILAVTGGGSVDNSFSYIGYDPSTTGKVTVDGAGSRWNNSSSLYVGHSSSDGMLNVAGGAAVTASSVSVDGESILAIDVGRGSTLDVNEGSGTIDNGGIVRVVAGAGAVTGEVYSPIAAGTWTGAGIYQAVGGTWDDGSHEFTVSDVESGTSGRKSTLDPSLTQRIQIDDGTSGWSVGASFLAADTSSTLDFRATPVDLASISQLTSLLEPEESVRGGWTFEIDGSGYATDDPAYLTFDIGSGFRRSDLDVWHFDGSQWTAFDATDLTYDGWQYASFTVTGFSGYAVSGIVGAANQWALPGDGSYNDPTSWSDAIVPDGVDLVANFLQGITAPSVVTVDSPVTVGTILFDNANAYTLAGPASLTLERSAGPAEIRVSQGDHAISTPLMIPAGLVVDALTGASLTTNLQAMAVITSDMTKRGEGTWSIDGGLGLLGQLDVEEGTLEIGPDLLAHRGGGDVTVAAGSTLRVSGTVNRHILGSLGDSFLQATGDADIGVLSSTDGFDFQGRLDVGSHTVGLKDADVAKLYGATLNGGTLSSFNGIEIQPFGVSMNRIVSGNGTINGNVQFSRPGEARAIVAGSTGLITMTGTVKGNANLFNVVIAGLYKPGFSPSFNVWAYSYAGQSIGANTEIQLLGPNGADVPEGQALDLFSEIPPGDYTQFYVCGNVDVAVGKFILFDFDPMLGPSSSHYAPQVGDRFDILVTGPYLDLLGNELSGVRLTYTDPTLDGLFDMTNTAPLAEGLQWRVEAMPDRLTLTVVPEPGTLILLLTGGLCLALAVWRRK